MCDSDEDGIVETKIEGADDDEMEWFLCRPSGVHSSWWDHYNKFNPLKHPSMKDKAACLLCFKAKKYTLGTVSLKGGNTSGLSRHFQHNHREEFDKFYSENKKMKATPPCG